MTANPRKAKDIEHFNSTAGEWSNTDESILPAKKALKTLGIQNGQSLLDVGAGTGVVLAALQKLGITTGRYLALDISSAMLKALSESYPAAETACADFEQPVSFGQNFDYVLIYNSIPHFTDLDMLFANAEQSLQPGGTFMIAHSRTRQGLKEHHQRIGHRTEREPIPSDEELLCLAGKYHFAKPSFQDEELFLFSCSR